MRWNVDLRIPIIWPRVLPQDPADLSLDQITSSNIYIHILILAFPNGNDNHLSCSVIQLCLFVTPWTVAREFQKNICFTDYIKALCYVDHDKLWKALREMGISDQLTCLLRNLHAGQEATVRTLYGTTGWFKITKGVWQSCLLSPCLSNYYMLSTSLEMLGWMNYKLESR